MAAEAEGTLGGARGCRAVGADEATERMARSARAESFMVVNCLGGCVYGVGG